MSELLALADKVRARCVVSPSGCVEWTGAKHSGGYGQIWFMGKVLYTHRVMYAAVKGAIPHGMEIDHLCRNRICCEPTHLEAVTSAENTRRGRAGEHAKLKKALIVKCPRGHPYDEANTYVCKRGRRSCRTCANARYRIIRQKASALRKATADALRQRAGEEVYDA